MTPGAPDQGPVVRGTAAAWLRSCCAQVCRAAGQDGGMSGPVRENIQDCPRPPALAAVAQMVSIHLGVTTRKCSDCPVCLNNQGIHAASIEGFSRSGRGPAIGAAGQM